MRFLVLFFLFSQFMLAQNSKLDSIQNLLLSPISLEDRVDIYHKLSYYYLPQDYDLSVLYADSSYRFSISLGDTFRIADAIDLYAKLKLRRGNSDSARYYYSQYENLFGGFSNSAYIENEDFLLGELGVLFFYKSNFDSALYYFAESIEKLSENAQEIKPHVMTAVPRLYEKIYDKIVLKGQDLSGVKKKLFFLKNLSCPHL